MRCKICKKVVSQAGKITRKRRICGNCMYNVRYLSKSINTSNYIKCHE